MARGWGRGGEWLSEVAALPSLQLHLSHRLGLSSATARFQLLQSLPKNKLYLFLCDNKES